MQYLLPVQHDQGDTVTDLPARLTHHPLWCIQYLSRYKVKQRVELQPAPGQLEPTTGVDTEADPANWGNVEEL